MADYSNLYAQAERVRNEVQIGANTASRIGVMAKETIASIEALDERYTQYQKESSEAIENITPKMFTQAEVDYFKSEKQWETMLALYPLIYVVEE